MIDSNGSDRHHSLRCRLWLHVRFSHQASPIWIGRSSLPKRLRSPNTCDSQCIWLLSSPSDASLISIQYMLQNQKITWKVLDTENRSCNKPKAQSSEKKDLVVLPGLPLGVVPTFSSKVLVWQSILNPIW